MMAGTRRACLGGMLALAACPSGASTFPQRLVSLDWGLAMTALALGTVPVGIAERRLYADWVGTPVIPPGVSDVGLRGQPSFESLAALHPDLILVNPLNTAMLPRLEQIAPTFMNTIFAEEKTPLVRARSLAGALAERLGCTARGETLVGDADAAMAAGKARLAGRHARAVVPVNAVDGRHVAVFGFGSLYHDVLTTLGLRTAAVGPTSMWGHRMIGVADIATLMPADLLVIAPLTASARQTVEEPGLWRGLLEAGGGRQFVLPASWAYGDIASAGRFATLVAAALADAPT